jgi:hypothetical protein
MEPRGVRKPLSLLVLLLLVAGGAVGAVFFRRATEESRAWRRFVELEGIDLPRVPNSPAAAPARRFAAPPPPRSEIDVEFLPWRVLRVRRDTADERTLLLFRPPDLESLCDEGLRVDVFGEDRRLLWSGWFVTGLGTAILEARVEDERLVLRTGPHPSAGPGPAFRQVYAVDAGRPALLRIENQDGKPERNDFSCGALTVGPPPEPLSPAAWERELAGPARLAALTTLGAFSPKHLRAGTYRRVVEAVQGILAARADPAVRARILELRASPDPWIREAAEAVPLDGSP